MPAARLATWPKSTRPCARYRCWPRSSAASADDAVVRGVLAQALVASRGPQWVCDKCHNVMADWSPVCDSCGGFDTLTWREPRAGLGHGAGNGVEMLPLLVGAPSTPVPARRDAAADAEVVTPAPRRQGPPRSRA